MTEPTKSICILHTMVGGASSKERLFATDQDVGVVALSEGPDRVRSRTDHALSGADTVRKALEAERRGYKAIVFSCHGDPELHALREAVGIPVLGTMEVAMHFCAMLSYKFSILVPELWIKREQEDNAIRYGMESRVASIRVVPFGCSIAEVTELQSKVPMPDRVIQPPVVESIKAIEEDDATAITFGCGCFTGMGSELKRRLKENGFEIPVVDPLPLAVDVARVLVKQGLSQSVLAYPRSRVM